MNFELTEEQKAVQLAARDFAQNKLLPGVIERDEHQKFPAERINELGELGFLGMIVDSKYGGSVIDSVSYVLAMEKISNIDASTYACMSVNSSMVCWGLECYANEEQKQKYLTEMTSSQKLGAFLLSDPKAYPEETLQCTTADVKGDHYIINGTKNRIPNGNNVYNSKYWHLSAKVMMNVYCLKDREKNQITTRRKHRGVKSISKPYLQQNDYPLTNPTQMKNIFVCYSQANMRVHDRLNVHIKPLAQIITMNIWSDQKIKAGQVWRREIEENLEKSVAVICLISADFMASDFIINDELPQILEAAEKKGKTIIPVIVSPCRFIESNLSQFQAINDPKKPLSRMSFDQREEVYVQIANRVEELTS